MVVGGAGKEAKVLGRTQQAHNKMAEELQRVNSDLATALKGLQEVRSALQTLLRQFSFQRHRQSLIATSSCCACSSEGLAFQQEGVMELL